VGTRIPAMMINLVGKQNKTLNVPEAFEVVVTPKMIDSKGNHLKSKFLKIHRELARKLTKTVSVAHTR
jgi:hypothetical protein